MTNGVRQADRPTVAAIDKVVALQIQAGILRLVNQDVTDLAAQLAGNGLASSGTVASINAALQSEILNRIAGDEDLSGQIAAILAQKGAANGIAPLGADSRVPLANLPDSLTSGLEYQGLWNADTNTPTIPAAGGGNLGFFYIVSVAGTTDIDGTASWAVGDWIVSNGTAWSKVPASPLTAEIAEIIAEVEAAREPADGAPYDTIGERMDAQDETAVDISDRVDAIRLETFLLPLGEYDDEPSVIHCDQNNLIFLRIDSAGINVNSGAVSSTRGTLYYLDDGVMMVADIDGERVFHDPDPLAFSGVVSIHQGNPVTAVNSPSLGAKTVVAVDPTRDIMMPYSDKLIAAVPSQGQSNCVGATATTIPSGLVTSDFPEEALMFTGDGPMDVRMALNVGTGGPSTLSGGSLTDFGGLVSRTGVHANSATSGVTPLEGMAKRIMHDCNAAFGVRPKHLFYTVGLSGTSYSGLKKGTTPHTNLLTAAQRAMEIAAAKGWKVWFPAVPIIHGEGDAANAGYEAALYEWQTDIETDIQALQVTVQGAAQAADIPILLSQPSTFQSDATKLAVTAMRAAMDSSTKIRIATPTYPFPFSSDLLHMNGIGQFLHGEYMAKAYMAFAWGRDWYPLSPVPGGIVWAGGTTVRIPMRVPVGAMVLDDVTIDDPNGKYGFRCGDSGGAITINSVAIDGDEVVLTLATTPGGSGRYVDYAWAGYGGTRIAGEGPRGCLRDSDTTPSLYDERPLYNWCIHFRETF